MKDNLSWILAMFGTAVGAGILFLPITAGLAGMIVLLVVMAVSIPTVYFAHRQIGVMLGEASKKVDYTGAVNEFLGVRAGYWMNIIFFITLFLLLIVYSSGLNEDMGAFMHDTGLTSRDLSQSLFLSLTILVILTVMIRIGEKVMLRFMGMITSLLVIMLLAVSVYLIPYWDVAVIGKIYGPRASSEHFLLLLPIFMLSFSYYPAMSSMVIAFKEKGLSAAEVLHRSRQVVALSLILLFFFITFFMLSCILALDPAGMEEAAAKNLSVLTVLAESSGSSLLEYAGPIIGQLALITSFIGTFLGARESARELLKGARGHTASKPRRMFRLPATDDLMLISFVLVIWLVTILHLPILDILGELVAPPIAFFLCILPIWITYRTERLKKYRRPALIFTLCIGCLMLFSYAAGKLV